MRQRSGQLLNVGRKTETIPPPIRRALAFRDQGCRFPGCTSRHRDAHHIEHWADGGETKFSNLVLLCRRRRRPLHEDSFTVRMDDHGAVRFAHPRGRPLHECPSPPPMSLDPARELIEGLEDGGILITGEESMPAWDGEPMDLRYVMECLWRAPPHFEAAVEREGEASRAALGRIGSAGERERDIPQSAPFDGGHAPVEAARAVHSSTSWLPPASRLVLEHSTTIRDVSRALPALVAEPDIKAVVSTNLLDTHAKGLRQQYDDLLPVIDRAGNMLAKAIERLDPEESPDPDGEGVAALEQAEVYFKHRQERLRHSRDAFFEVGASPSHEVFQPLDRLGNLYTWIVATMQEVRWAVLIAEGFKDKAESPEGRSFTSSAQWLASLRED